MSLPSLSMRGRGLSEHTKGKEDNPRQRITGGMEGWRDRARETTRKEPREGQREGFKSFPIRNRCAQERAKESTDERLR